MIKYIDAEKLIAKLTKMQFEINAAYRKPQSDNMVRAISLEYDDILSLVDSLQQEQTGVCEPEYGPYARQYPKSKVSQEPPKPNLDNEIKDYTETLYHETFGNGQGTLDEFDWEDIAQIIDETVRHFYELWLKTRKEE